MMAAPLHGRVSGGGLDCGSGGPVCQVTLGSATVVTIAATPNADHVFLGWTGDCRGGLTTTVHVNGPKACAALFEPFITTSPRTVMYWDSEPGESIGQGGRLCIHR